MDLYVQEGYRGREGYLISLAESYGVPLDEVQDLADVLGEEEDFDLLVSTLEDLQ